MTSKNKVQYYEHMLKI